MSRKHNTVHTGRGRSNYPARLQRRGLNHAPAMADLDTLRHRHQRRYDQSGSPWPDAWVPPVDLDRLNGIFAAYGGNYDAYYDAQESCNERGADRA